MQWIDSSNRHEDEAARDHETFLLSNGIDADERRSPHEVARFFLNVIRAFGVDRAEVGDEIRELFVDYSHSIPAEIRVESECG